MAGFSTGAAELIQGMLEASKKTRPPTDFRKGQIAPGNDSPDQRSYDPSGFWFWRQLSPELTAPQEPMMQTPGMTTESMSQRTLRLFDMIVQQNGWEI